MSAISDPIADFLTRLRNASTAGIEFVEVPYSKIKADIGRILLEEGYVWSSELVENAPKPTLRVKLKYDKRQPVLRHLKRISRPGIRKYVGSTDIPRVLGGLGIAIVSTSKGVMTGWRARKSKLGGELLAEIW
jgi:small subunit ribosomal protein S8